MAEIILHGILAKKFRPRYNFASIKKVEDCISAVDCISSGFKKFILEESTRGVNYEFVIDGNRIKTQKDYFAVKNFKTVEIVPSIGGADPVSFFVTLAINLVMAGIAYLMTPIPELDLGPEPSLEVEAQTYFFSTLENTAQQGVSVPVCYGTLRAGSKIIQTARKSIQNANSNRASVMRNEAGDARYLEEDDSPIYEDVINKRVGAGYFDAVFGRDRIVYDKMYKSKDYGQDRGDLDGNIDRVLYFKDNEGNVFTVSPSVPLTSDSSISVAIHHDGI